MDDKAPTPEHRLGFLLYRAGLAVEHAYALALRPLGVAPAEAGLLSSLAYAGPAHVRALGRSLGLGRQTVVNLTRKLAADGLVVSSASPDDARLTLFAITDAGRARLGEIEAVATAFDRRLRAAIDGATEPTLVEQLQRIVAAPDFARAE